MTVTLTATAGASDANTYVTDAEMTTYISTKVQSAAATAWGALTADERAQFLIEACRQLDRAHRYKGQRCSDLTGASDQALEFPRFSLNYRGGKSNLEAYRGAGSYAVDQRVKRAQMEQALYLCQIKEVEGGDDPIGGSARAKLQAEGVKSIQIGNTSEAYTGKYQILCAAAEAELRPLIKRSFRM